ncbi:MAG: hypothetical protein ACREV0_14195 [Burkholderiales bacterium]
METNETIKIIQALANGTDPMTGEVFSDSSPYNHPKIIRALFQTLKALEKYRGREERVRNLPGNAGKPWHDDQDRELISGFDAGASAKELAAKHGRTEYAITARLVKLGKISEPVNSRQHAVQAAK